MRQWETDDPLEADEARHQIFARFPDLAGESVTPLGSGWDNTAFLERLSAMGAPLEALRVVEKLARDAEKHPNSEDCSVLCHGDLYARHLMVDDDRVLVGVIDWGDRHAGDRAMDLGIAWSFLPPVARPAFRAAYGPISDGAWSRARVRAFHYASHLVTYGLEVGDAAMEVAGREALRLGLQVTNGS